jgi:hypothetical protein
VCLLKKGWIPKQSGKSFISMPPFWQQKKCDLLQTLFKVRPTWLQEPKMRFWMILILKSLSPQSQSREGMNLLCTSYIPKPHTLIDILLYVKDEEVRDFMWMYSIKFFSPNDMLNILMCNKKLLSSKMSYQLVMDLASRVF